MPAINLPRKAHVDSRDFFGEDEGARAETDGEEFGLQFAHSLGEGHHFYMKGGKVWSVRSNVWCVVCCLKMGWVDG